MPLFIPIGDDNQGRTIVPKVTYALIALNALVYFAFQTGANGERFTNSFALYSYKIVAGESAQETMTESLEIFHPGVGDSNVPDFLTLLSCLFLHGNLWHLLGNLVFLWVVGDNVEDDLGHVKFLIFYLVCGILAGLTHVAMNSDSLTPMIGASGAIAGIMGAYLLKHPTRRIYVFLYKILLPLPAWLAVGAWFVLQIIGGLGRLGPSGEGIAYAAHIGGFFAGLLLVNLFANSRTIEDHVTRAELAQLYRSNSRSDRIVE